MSTPAVDPHARPSGSLAQSETVRYGLGWVFASLDATATAAAANRMGPASIHTARFCRVIRSPPQSSNLFTRAARLQPEGLWSGGLLVYDFAGAPAPRLAVGGAGDLDHASAEGARVARGI